MFSFHIVLKMPPHNFLCWMPTAPIHSSTATSETNCSQQICWYVTLSVLSRTLLSSHPGSKKVSTSSPIHPVSSLIAEHERCSICTSEWTLHYQECVPARTFWDLQPLGSFEIHSASSLHFSLLRLLPNSVSFAGFTHILEYADSTCLRVSLKMVFAGFILFSYCFCFIFRSKGEVCDLNSHVHTENPGIEILKETEDQVSK